MEAPTWSELPDDIFCSVLQLLECPDILRSSAVCTAWNKAFSSARCISACPARQTPCLLYCTNATGQTALGIYSLSERRAYTMRLPADPPVSNWVGSSHGWLVAMDDKSDLMLLNPITHDKVALPPAAAMEHVKPILNDHGALHSYEVSYYYGPECTTVKDDTPYAFSLDEYGDVVYLKATLSSDPSTGECTVMLIHHPYWQLSFAKAGDDRWTWLRADIYYKDCIYHDGLFYAMTAEGAIDAFDLNGPSVIQNRVLPPILDSVQKCYILPAPWGDVLQIYKMRLYNPDAPDGERFISEIDVYKVDFVEQKRIKMTGVGQYALFIGKNTTSCFSVKDYPELLPNHVYFTDDDPENLIDGKDDPRKIGVYNLENKTTSNVVYPELWMTWLPPIWLTPSLSNSSSGPIDLLFRPLTMEVPTWSELPADIFCSILQLLECPDILRSSAVCTAWNKAFSTVRRISACPARQTPCLLYCTSATGQTALGMYSLSERRAYTMLLPADPPVSNWIGSSHGWLVAMDDKSDLMLLNPITRDKVALPPAAAMEHVKPVLNDQGALHKYEMSYYYGPESKRVKNDTPYAFSLDEYGDEVYIKATLSSDPSAGGCTVVLIHQPYWQLSFAKVGDDHWTWIRADRNYKDCIYHDGLFYAMAGQGAIDAFDLNGPSVIHKRVLPKVLEFIEECYILQAPWGDVLQIYRLEVFNPNAPDGERYIPEIEVYKVNFVEQKRIKMTGIGQYALFIGKNTTSCFSVKDYPELLPNHVYFTDDNPEDLVDAKDDPRKIGVYNLQTKTIYNVVYPELWMTWLPPIWLTPSLANGRNSILSPEVSVS